MITLGIQCVCFAGIVDLLSQSLIFRVVVQCSVLKGAVCIHWGALRDRSRD